MKIYKYLLIIFLLFFIHCNVDFNRNNLPIIVLADTIQKNTASTTNTTSTPTNTPTETPTTPTTPTTPSAPVVVPSPFYRWQFNNDYTSSTSNAKTGTATQVGTGPNVVFNNSIVREGSHSIFFGTTTGAYNNGASVDFGATNLGNQFTFTLWAYIIAPSGGYTEKLQTILTNKVGTSGINDGFSIFFNKYSVQDQSVLFNTGNGTVSGQFDSNTNVISYNTWTHFSFVFDRNLGTAKVYINGSPIASTTTYTIRTDFTNTTSLRLGGLGSPTFFHYSGYVDDMRYYNQAFTDSEIQTIFTNY
ncbi:MAG: LamG domain-containing protein [Leptospiraceae bacterium]|nr:LamG domain-containing protein [Leptospiraceae bacterium]